MNAGDRKQQARRSLAVALDTDDWPTYCRWCALLGPRVGVLKVGLEAFVSWGPRAVSEAKASGARVFLDVKLHDIPNTVAGAVRAARSLEVDLLTLHAGGGPAMMGAACEAAAGEVSLLAVTVLTHLEPAALDRLGMPGSSEHRVAAWTALAAEAGCQGVVCSALEVARLRTSWQQPFLLVTPGIRPAGSSVDDQRRVATPRQALELGADLLVVGRPITRATDPVEALELVLGEMAAGEQHATLG